MMHVPIETGPDGLESCLVICQIIIIKILESMKIVRKKISIRFQ